MRTVKLSVLFVVCACVVLVTGCVSEEFRSLHLKNAKQAERIDVLSSERDAAMLQLDQLRRQLDAAKELGGTEVWALQQEVTALKAALEKKKALIDAMQGQLLGGGQLPVELSTMLEDFAEKEEMVTYDASRGVVKFKSDLLFRSGSDVVQPDAQKAIKLLCGILSSQEGRNFDIIIAGHTDDQPIRASAARHPTNWHLSAHRAISVLKIMEGSNIDSVRVSARGFGEFRPVVPNEPGQKGHPQNRRVEVYIVPKGT
jgi:chemotaxis protein MotB